MKAVTYQRISTDGQEQGSSLQTQLEACLIHCKNRGYEVSANFSETFSGQTMDRPKLIELRELARSGKIDVLVVYCIDRLSRNATQGVIIRDELDKFNVKLESVTEDIDKTPLGEAITYLRGTFAQIEAEKIKERTTRGKRALLKQGKIPSGCGVGIYGYSWDKVNKKRIPLEFEAKVVQRIFDELVVGKGYYNIACRLNENNVPSKKGGKWSTRTVYNLAGNPAYCGLTFFGQTRGSRKTKLIRQPKSDWILLPDATPAIISQEQFDRVQEMRQKNRELHKVKVNHQYVLRGHARCGLCGAPLVGSFMNHQIRYYHCRGAYSTATRLKQCDARYIRADYLETVVWQNVRKVLEQPEVVMAGVKEELALVNNSDVQGIYLAKEIDKLRKQVIKYDSEEKRLIQLFRYGAFNPDAILDEINHLKHDKEADTLQVANLTKTKERIESLKQAELELSVYCQSAKHRLDSASYDEKREILEMLGIKVKATTESINIEGVIPLETTPSESELASAKATHHWTNIGITTWT